VNFLKKLKRREKRAPSIRELDLSLGNSDVGQHVVEGDCDSVAFAEVDQRADFRLKG